MNLAYIILTHTAPTHFARLVNRLCHPDDTLFVHIDIKSDINEFKKVVEDLPADIHFVNARENGRWGDIGIVKATLNAMMEIVRHKTDFDHVILLSGTDYPIRPLEQIRNFYFQNKNYSFITYEPLPAKQLNFGGMDRINCYTYNFLGKRETFLPLNWTKHLSLKGKLFNFILGIRTLFKPKRQFPFDWKPYYGSQWWSMSSEACEFIVKFNTENPDYLKYHTHTQLPDEVFFQSLLLNSYPHQYLIINNNKRFIEFESDSSHPKTIEMKDLDDLRESDRLFARKFEENSVVLNEIDKI